MLRFRGSVMMRPARDPFDALMVANAMAQHGFRIVSVTPWEGGLHVFAQLERRGEVNATLTGDVDATYAAMVRSLAAQDGA
jgi:hypothetical protein